MGRDFVRRYQDLEVYQMAFEEAMRIFEASKAFPVEERYSLTDQMRRSSRSICANLAEAWRKRCYEAAFIAKLTDCAAETSETQTWIAFGSVPISFPHSRTSPHRSLRQNPRYVGQHDPQSAKMDNPQTLIHSPTHLPSHSPTHPHFHPPTLPLTYPPTLPLAYPSTLLPAKH
ncbi:four helix bundle protein [Gloeocapsopsis sp. IPPAS B-1203]|uniref:four helix bundle protein n=1 Tax=Gloeocapsopsis sp. IPPAS B-1203 TaxID=2049454 RepID=UPI0026C23E6E